MSLKNQSVTILGAGIGGLTAAVAMSQRGARVTIFDQIKRQSSIGAGIQISPNGFGVMDTLGLASQLLSKGNILEFINVQNYKKPLFSSRVDLMRVTHGNPNPHLVIHRSDLVGLLIKKIKKLGVIVHFDKKAKSINYDDKEIEISFGDETVHKTDMLVGADGIHSIVRKSIGYKAKPKFTGKVAWRALIKSKFIPLNDLPSEATIRFGPNRHLVTYPIRDGNLVNLVAVEKRDEWVAEGWNHSDKKENLERSFQHWPTDILKLLSVAEKVKLWGLFSHDLPKKWHSSGIVLIGDSCHPMVPFLGQGANMAIEDAWVLAEELDSSINLEEGFKKYQLRRYNRIKKVSMASLSNGDIYHAVGVKANIIDLGMKASYKFKPSFIQSKYDWLYGVDVSRGD
jgi:salicylate hydroxylase